MSKVGKQIIQIPEKVEVSLQEGVFTVKSGPSTLTKIFKPIIDVKINGKEITLSPKAEDVFTRSLWGTYASHIKNMIEGVTRGYTKKLILEGVGFKSEVKGKDLVFALGFSHPVVVPIPPGIKATAEKNLITISGIDKEKVGEFSAKLRDMKKPEPYKGKGFRYEGEVIRRKQGKKSA
ncbi:MAG TPA: 50S ribosomal protein L6 [Candidatus Paceibacterota bacterium]